MPRASPLFRLREIDEAGNLFDLAIWRVPVTPTYPHGVRYRLAFVRRGDDAPTVLYDNHAPKGDHRHTAGVEQPYAFVDVDQLVSDFRADAERAEETR